MSGKAISRAEMAPRVQPCNFTSPLSRNVSIKSDPATPECGVGRSSGGMVIQMVQANDIAIAVLEASELFDNRRGQAGMKSGTDELTTSFILHPSRGVEKALGEETHVRGPIVFASDFDPITSSAMGYAKSLCTILGLKLHCLHVLPLSTQKGKEDVGTQFLIANAFTHLLKQNGDAIEDVTIGVSYGNRVSDSIIQYAVDTCASLIVMGSNYPQSESPSLLASVVNDGPCPIVIGSVTQHAFENNSEHEQTTSQGEIMQG